MTSEGFFGFEDGVVENLFIVSHAHCDRYECKIVNIKLVVKYCHECNGLDEKKTAKPWMYHVHVLMKVKKKNIKQFFEKI